MDRLMAIISIQIPFSRKAFGDGRRTESLCKHIESELDEIRESPTELEEWVDVILLALDGAWRAGHSAEEIIDAIGEKQAKNIRRKWGENRGEDFPVNHTDEMQGDRGSTKLREKGTEQLVEVAKLLVDAKDMATDEDDARVEITQAQSFILTDAYILACRALPKHGR